MKKLLLPAAVLITLSSILLFSFSDKTSNTKSVKLKARVELTGKSKEKALTDVLLIQCMDKTTQWDKKVSIVYTNFSENMTIKLTKTGIKYNSVGSDKSEYIHRNTPIILQPLQTVQLEVSVPRFSKPKVAYALLDDALVYQN